MPKARVAKKNRSQPGQGRPIRVKFRIGPRGSVKSALRMKTEELLEALQSGSTRRRDKSKIRQVLAMRSVAA